MPKRRRSPAALRRGFAAIYQEVTSHATSSSRNVGHKSLLGQGTVDLFMTAAWRKCFLNGGGDGDEEMEMGLGWRAGFGQAWKIFKVRLSRRCQENDVGSKSSGGEAEDRDGWDGNIYTCAERTELLSSGN